MIPLNLGAENQQNVYMLKQEHICTMRTLPRWHQAWEGGKMYTCVWR